MVEDTAEACRVEAAQCPAYLLRRAVAQGVGMTRALPLDNLERHRGGSWAGESLDDDVHRLRAVAVQTPPRPGG
jgi:hypothetical protein